MTDRMQAILDLLADGRARTPNDIARDIGIRATARRRRGPWVGSMAPAQHIISSLNSLRRQGLITIVSRPDGYTGTAYIIVR